MKSAVPPPSLVTTRANSATSNTARILSAIAYLFLAACGGEIRGNTDLEDASTASATKKDAAAESDAETALDTNGTESDPDANFEDADAAAGSPGSTAGDEGDSGSDANLPSETDALVTFVASAHGGWTAKSCDGGQTWVAQQQTTESIASDPYSFDHGEYSAFAGVTFAMDRFFMATGWGTTGHLYASDDGQVWNEFPTPAGAGDYGAMITAGERVVAMRGSQGDVSFFSDDGTTWTQIDAVPDGVTQVRQARGFSDGVIVMIATGANTTTQVSTGDLGQWSSATLPGDCENGVQRFGGIARLGDRILIASKQALCLSENLGSSWTVIRTGLFPGVFESDSHFYLIEGKKILRSSDGRTWNEVATVDSEIDEGLCFDGTCVVVPLGGGAAYVSKDGVAWEKAGTVPDSGAVQITSMAAGKVVAGEGC